MEKINLCKGDCGNTARYSGWCGIKWRKGNKICVDCPELEKKRSRSISKYRIKEAKLGLNPMQDPKICKRNHSIKRNKKASKTLKRLGRLKLLPQQTESKELNEKRLRKIREALKKLAKEGKLNHQMESKRKKIIRHRKISKTLREKYSNGTIKLVPAQGVNYYSKNNGNVKLRSGWEHEVAKFLDSNRISWEYEPFGIKYWNSIKGQKRTTFPDFFLPSYNLFIEVKTTYKEINKDANDKIKGIKKAGFNALLWMDKEIDLIRKRNYTPLLKKIRVFGETNA